MNRILNIIKVNTRVFASQWHFAPRLGIGLFLTSSLMALNGIYARLFDIQAKGYSE